MAIYKQGASGPVGPDDRLDGGSVPDTALSSTSTNSVQNKKVKEAIYEINTALSNYPAFAYSNRAYDIVSDGTYTNIREVALSDPLSWKNQPRRFYQKANGTALSGMPTDFPSGTGCLGVRYVHYYDANNVTIELVQCNNPTAVYFDTWNGSAWGGWKKLTLASV